MTVYAGNNCFPSHLLVASMNPGENEPALDWPREPGTGGREIWYLLVTSRDRSVAFWYHIELVATDNGWQEGQSWVTLSERGADDHSVFVSEVVSLDSVRFETDPFEMRANSQRLTDSSANGEIIDSSGVANTDPLTAQWDLEYEPDEYTFTPLRSQRLTDFLSKATGSGKHWSCNQSVAMSGVVTVGDRTVEFDDAPGHQGHTVSSKAPAGLTWVHCNDFETDGLAADVTLEALQYEQKLSLCLRVDGEVYAFNRLHHVLPTSPFSNTVVCNEVGNWTFRAKSHAIELEATVDADGPWERTTQYLPTGDRRYDAHCPFASVKLTYTDDTGQHTLTSDAARAEWIRPTPPVVGEYLPSWN